jgi:hypothetical protein
MIIVWVRNSHLRVSVITGFTDQTAILANAVGADLKLTLPIEK